jgi:Myo-inositol-1-phosphate synthase
MSSSTSKSKRYTGSSNSSNTGSSSNSIYSGSNYNDFDTMSASTGSGIGASATTTMSTTTMSINAAVATSIQQQQQQQLEELKPKPVLSKDSTYKPKTTGSFGLMIVGLGGANGTTMLAGILANRLNINWHGPRGEKLTPNYYGCITQLNTKGGGVGYKDRIKGLADASMAAVGGWVRFFFLLYSFLYSREKTLFCLQTLNF